VHPVPPGRWTNEFIAALTLTTSNSTMALTVRLDSIIGQYTVDWQHLFGPSVVATIPVLVLFALIERRVVSASPPGPSGSRRPPGPGRWPLPLIRRQGSIRSDGGLRAVTRVDRAQPS
jgi:hypothetical protein